MNWQLISASCIGSHHRDELTPHNGQDAAYFNFDPDSGTGFAVVADGCGSSPHSEVGAHLGVRLLADIWNRQGRKTPGYKSFLGHVFPRSQDFQATLIDPLLQELRCALSPLGDASTENQLKDAVATYGFFTLNGVVFNREAMVFFCIGDGVCIVNGQATVIEPPKRDDPRLDNAPQYIGYSVYDPGIPVDLRYYRVWPTKDVESFLVASDGFGPLLTATDTPLPGQQRTVGSVDQLWTEDKYFVAPREGEQPVRAQLWLNLAAQTKKKLKRGPNGPLADIETFPGLLNDDTTFIVGRRQLQEPANTESEVS